MRRLKITKISRQIYTEDETGISPSQSWMPREQYNR